MEELGQHHLTHEDWSGKWTCSCDENFDHQSEAMAHARAVNSPSHKWMNCIARQTHHSQPTEIVYEMRATLTTTGVVVSSPIEQSPWMICPQGSAERSRVTKFGCPNCGHVDEVTTE